jgi:para-nitrobenzyl esterase
VALLVFAVVLPAQAAGPEVTVEAGTLESVDLGGGLAVFRGIPYAEVPERWVPPQPVRAWPEVRPATEFGPACAQTPFMLGLFGEDASVLPPTSEDCLYLNIWTTNADNASAPLPVMVWIHGGGFSTGWGGPPGPLNPYDGAHLARSGAVVVTLNYRLGVLGFLAHPALSAEAGGASGNYAFMDQIAALRWVKQNIAEFGGDPDRVTVFGQSAGAMSIATLLSTPAAEGLIDRAILQSTGELHLFSSLVEAERHGEAVAAAVDASGSRENQLAVLRSAPVEELMAAATAVSGGGPDLTGPTLDGRIVSELPARVAVGRGLAPVPLIIGNMAAEMIGGPLAFMLPSLDQAGFDALLDRDFGADAGRMRSLYPTRDGIGEALGRLETDRIFTCTTRLLARHHPAPVWVYRLSRATPGGGRGNLGASHGADLVRVFNTFPADFPLEESDRKLTQAILGYWSNFAERGDPNEPGLSEWPRFAPDSEPYLELGDSVSVAEGFPEGCAAVEDAVRRRIGL